MFSLIKENRINWYYKSIESEKYHILLFIMKRMVKQNSKIPMLYNKRLTI